MLENATRICEAKFGNLHAVRGRRSSGAARCMAPARMDWKCGGASRVVRKRGRAPFSRVIRTKRLQHIADMRLDEAYPNTTRP